jgi:hypothetical protein
VERRRLEVEVAASLPPAALAVLDFWLGHWSVRRRDGEPAGTDHVERVLGGYAVLEHWRGVTGDEGKSLFYFDRSAGTWKQVWAIEGYVKEKTLVIAEPGRVRFQGHAHVDGATFPDRTTLTALPDGEVGQLIEHSLDDGATWKTSFDAVYTAFR